MSSNKNIDWSNLLYEIGLTCQIIKKYHIHIKDLWIYSVESWKKNPVQNEPEAT